MGYAHDARESGSGRAHHAKLIHVALRLDDVLAEDHVRHGCRVCLCVLNRVFLRPDVKLNLKSELGRSKITPQGGRRLRRPTASPAAPRRVIVEGCTHADLLSMGLYGVLVSIVTFYYRLARPVLALSAAKRARTALLELFGLAARRMWPLEYVVSSLGWGHASCVKSVAVIGEHVYTGCWDFLVKKWDTQSGACVHTFVGHQQDIIGIAPSPSGRFIFSCGDLCRMWDVDTGEEVARFGQGTYYCAVASARCVYTAKANGLIEEFEYALADGAPGASGAMVAATRSFAGHLAGVMDFDLRGDLLVSASIDMTARAWSISSGSVLQSFSVRARAGTRGGGARRGHPRGARDACASGALGLRARRRNRPTRSPCVRARARTHAPPARPACRVPPAACRRDTATRCAAARSGATPSSQAGSTARSGSGRSPRASACSSCSGTPRRCARCSRSGTPYSPPRRTRRFSSGTWRPLPSSSRCACCASTRTASSRCARRAGTCTAARPTGAACAGACARARSHRCACARPRAGHAPR